MAFGVRTTVPEDERKAAMDAIKDRIARRDAATVTLFRNIKARLPELRTLLAEVDGEWVGEDLFYRFYHHSFKVYRIQDETNKIVDVLKSLLLGVPLNDDFLDIVFDGTGKVFSQRMNNNWFRHGRPMLEAFFHARRFLELVCRSGESMSEDDLKGTMPSGWAAVLYLWNLR